MPREGGMEGPGAQRLSKVPREGRRDGLGGIRDV